MKYIKYSSVLVILFSCYFSFSQDCTLNVGGSNEEIIISVFQLNSIQKNKLKTIKEAYSVDVKALEDEISKLMEDHPQSTPEDLEILGNKYIVLKNKLTEKSEETDLELLKIFNQKQYSRYVELCNEAYRKPFKITPIVYKDSTGQK